MGREHINSTSSFYCYRHVVARGRTGHMQSSERGCSSSPTPAPSARMLQKKMTCETKLERHPATIRESGEREACGRHGTGPKGPALTG